MTTAHMTHVQILRAFAFFGPATLLGSIGLSTPGWSMASAIAPAQEGGAVEGLLDATFESAAKAEGLDELWVEVARLVEGSEELEEGALQGKLVERLAQPSVNSMGELFLIGARIQLEDADAEALADRLQALLTKADAPAVVARGAAALLEDPLFLLSDEDRRAEMVDALIVVAQDGNREPELRLEAATTAIERGNGQQSRVARREILAFLDSSDPALRGLAALALARGGDRDTGRSELERLSRLPGNQGRLAASLLDQQKILVHKDRQLKNQRKFFTDKLDDDAEGTTKATREAQMLDRLLRLVEHRHLEGDVFSRDELVDNALDGVMRSLDSHSSFLSSTEFSDFSRDLLTPEYGGIGAYVGTDPDDNLFSITRPIYSGPAYRAGLVSGDKIVQIDEWPTIGETVDDIIKRLKGKPGTTVRLYIWRQGMDTTLIERPSDDMLIEIVRERIVPPYVSGDMLPGKIGLVELTSFSSVASDELRPELDRLLDEGAEAIVLDLRRNLGGLLREAANVCDLFLPKDKLVTYTESRIEDTEKWYTQTDPLVPMDIPVVVLIDRFSASASEIVSGALQDHGRATIVGQRSFGKGSVQQLLLMPGERDDRYRDENGNGQFDPWEKIEKDWNNNEKFDYAPRVRMTISRYMLPSGRSIHRELDREGNIESPGGVEPDIAVNPRRWEQWKLEEMVRINKTRDIRRWADEVFEANKETLVSLALSDEHDWEKYPGFDELYTSLETNLPRKDVRYLMRLEIRRRAQDERGSAFPAGDYEEDPMLQAAIRNLLEEQGKSYYDVPAFAKTFDAPSEREAPPENELVSAELSRTDLENAITLVDEARRDDGRLSIDSLRKLSELLNSIED